MKDPILIDLLTDLAQLDIDAVGAYNQALENISDQEIYNQINSFKNDHVEHIEELSGLIKEYGGVPPEKSPDLKGYLIEGFTFLRSSTGTKGALSAMEMNEKMTNKNYKQALEENPELPSPVKALLIKNYADEKRHLNYISSTLVKLKEKVTS